MKPSLGYYYQNPIKYDGNSYQLPNDLYLACIEFKKFFKEIFIFANSANTSNRNTIRVPDYVQIIDLGPLQPHWRRLFGSGFDRKKFSESVKYVDAIIIQGPTTLVPYLSKYTPSSVLQIFLQVGFWSSTYKDQFRSHSLIKEIGLQIMIRIAEFQQRRAFRRGVIFSNNPLKLKMYKKLAPGILVSKGLVKASEITPRKDFSVDKTVQLLSYGRVESDKHIETILKTLDYLNRNYEKHNFQLHIVGDSSPAYKTHLESLVHKLDLNNVNFQGAVPFQEKDKWFNKSDIYIFHTCGTEGFPRTIWEAFSYGIPVVAANYPGADLFFENEKQLLLFPRKDYKALAQRIIRIIEEEKLAADLSKNSQKMLKNYTLEEGHKHMAESIIDLLDSKDA